MASTITIQASMNFVAPILKNQPLMVSGQEPALTAANVILGSILGPPMKWRNNRREISFAISNGGGSDYAQSLSDFGYIEQAWLVDASNNQFALDGKVALSKNPGVSARPEKIAPQFDDNNNNITFRLDKIPDKNYTLFLDYQRKAPVLSSVAASWGPVADEFAFIYQYGYLAIMSLLVNDSRFPIFENYFIGRLLGAQDGLSEQEKNIFLGNWVNVLATVKRGEGAVNSGVTGRTR